MKKAFALVLAVAMVMSLAAVSFAATSITMTGLDSSGANTPNPTAFKYDADKDEMQDKGYIEWGKAAYFPITFDNGIAADYDQVAKLKVKAAWEMGKDLVESVSIVKKYVDNFGTADYLYFVEVKVVNKETYSDADVIGTLTFNQKAIKEADYKTGFEIAKIDDLDVDISFNVRYEYASDWADAKEALVDEEDMYIRYDRAYGLKFSSDLDDDVEFTFGGTKGVSEENEGTFTVDCSGQGKVYMKVTTTADEDIMAANPGAKAFFVNFNGVKFNRTGEFMYEMEDGKYCYEIKDGKLVAIPGAEYDDADEAFYFKTRVLGNYVFSDIELVNPVVAAVEAPAADAATNPTTGAAA